MKGNQKYIEVSYSSIEMVVSVANSRIRSMLNDVGSTGIEIISFRGKFYETEMFGSISSFFENSAMTILLVTHCSYDCVRETSRE